MAALQQLVQGQAAPSNRPSWFPYAGYVSAGLVVLAVLAFVVAFTRGEWRTYTAGKARHEERQAPGSDRTIAIGPLGIYQSGFSVPLVGSNLRLSHVYIDPSDPSLLKFQMFYGQNIPTGISVPIPNGQEASARQLVERFKEEVL